MLYLKIKLLLKFKFKEEEKQNLKQKFIARTIIEKKRKAITI